MFSRSQSYLVVVRLFDIYISHQTINSSQGVFVTDCIMYVFARILYMVCRLKISDRDLPMILYMIRKRGFLIVLGRVH